jgi:aspartyl-tRNA(Asn)/glutamyl-tRNA(Gln) amidotransferase subunit A
MTGTTALIDLSLRAASDLLHRRALSPVELTEAYLARIERWNPHVNAYLTIMAEDARATARRAEVELGARTDRGPLHGIPLGLKDLLATAGVRTTAGSQILADWIPTEDATVVRRLRTAGAVLLGKCAMTEFAMGHPHNPHYGPTRNPWSLAHVPWGSSSGSGVAVAGRLAVAALGSDTACSLRQPASYCGVVGLRPSQGRVSTAGVVPLARSFDTAGPLARTVGLRLTVPFTAFGGPSLSVPCGFSAAGLPIGLQLAGRRFDEAIVLRVGHAYEQSTDWHRRRPPFEA